MKRNIYLLAAAVTAVALAGAGCSSSEESSTTTSTPASGTSTTTSATVATTTTTSAAATTTPATGNRADLASLIDTPANSQRTDGPDPVHDNGIHLHFLVTGAPTEVMDAYKAALEGKGWTLTVENSGGGGGGGGATYSGTNGTTFGVFTGGGYGNTTDVDSCAWPSKPSNTNCGGHH